MNISPPHCNCLSTVEIKHHGHSRPCLAACMLDHLEAFEPSSSDSPHNLDPDKSLEWMFLGRFVTIWAYWLCNV
ncbi:MAG: hypothetical protein R3B91_18860 [Planctomycetaceae bacterium]|nr:hypothetical protein [Planctomycetaceae bacterium]